MNQISYQLKDIVMSINKIVDCKDKTKIAMENISAISEETAATTEQVSFGANGQISEIQKIFEFVEELNSVVEKLNLTINKFIVN